MTENGTRGRRLEGALLAECAEWTWEQLQEEGFFLAGELVELILEVERELGVQGDALEAIARRVAEELRARGIKGEPYAVDAPLVLAVLQWEDEFLGFAGIARAES